MDQLIDIIRTRNVRIDCQGLSADRANLLDRVLGNGCAADVIHGDGGPGFGKCECYIPTSQITRRRSLKDESFSPASVQFKGLIAPHGAA